MKTSLLTLSCVLLALTGCQTTIPVVGPKTYTKFTVTNPRGDLIATWIAEGPFSKTDDGFRIHAVERNKPAPDNLHIEYPNGRDATVVGPNIVFQKVEKPLWLMVLDGETTTTTTTETKVTRISDGKE